MLRCLLNSRSVLYRESRKNTSPVGGCFLGFCPGIPALTMRGALLLWAWMQAIETTSKGNPFIMRSAVIDSAGFLAGFVLRGDGGNFCSLTCLLPQPNMCAKWRIPNHFSGVPSRTTAFSRSSVATGWVRAAFVRAGEALAPAWVDRFAVRSRSSKQSPERSPALSRI
jgi:hypothetical protein